ncbi:MAG: antitoxin family protein [Planctomycetaceae bacterium]
MSLQIEATYENGTLKPDHALPLAEKQRVTVIIHEQARRGRHTYGLIGWKGDPEIIRKIALEPEFGIAESP